MVEKQATRNLLSYKPTEVTLKFVRHFCLLNTVMLIMPEDSIFGRKSDTEWQKEKIS